MSDQSQGGTGRWLKRITQSMSGEPRDLAELIEDLRGASTRGLFDGDALVMLEGVLAVADMQVRDIMVPRSQMVFVERDAPVRELLASVVESGHSRFPVIGEDRDQILGILLAKDLLRLQMAKDDEAFEIREFMRPAVFVPESKRLNELLRDFRSNRNHLAIVIDEFGNTAGLITIEDVLEEIVGEIEDEFDDADAESGVYSLADGSMRVAGNATIAEVNHAFNVALPEDAFDTIGGIVSHELGHVPRRGETTSLGGLQFSVMLTRGGAVRWFKVTRPAADSVLPASDELGG